MTEDDSSSISELPASPSFSLSIPVNGSSTPGTPTQAPPETPPASRAGGRSTSEKFANLRAAFERDGSPGSVPDGLKRRLPSSDRVPSFNRERNQDQDAEIAKLREDFAHEKELRTAYEDRVTSLEEEIDDLNAQLATRDGDVEERLYVAQSEASTHRRENSALQQQLADLKRDISSSARSGNQTTDSALEQEFGLLQHEAQNWVVNHFRKAKMEASPEELGDRLESMGEIKHLDRLKPIYERFEPAKKLAIFQATLACYLMEIFEEKFLFGMPPDQEWRKRIRKAAESLPVALSPTAYNRWRAATFDALRQSESIKESMESATHGIAEMVCITLKTMTEVEDTDGKLLASLKPIVKRAVNLAQLIRVQHANYEFELPRPKELFDSTQMEDFSFDDDENTAEQRTIHCATFPAVVKVSDDQGDHSGARNIIVKAKVLCDTP